MNEENKKLEDDIDLNETVSPVSPGQYICAALIAALGIFSVVGFGTNNIADSDSQSAGFQAAPDAFSGTEITAVAAYVFDITDEKELFEKNSDSQLPLASLTKIMTAITALSITERNTVVDIDKEFLSEEGDTGLYANEKWKLKDLLRFTLMQSSNDGAFAIASVAGAIKNGAASQIAGRKEFITEMNNKARELGLGQTFFINETGLDISGTLAGGYGSAKDAAKMMGYAVRNYRDIFEATTQPNWTVVSESKLSHPSKNTNYYVNNIPGLVGSKTGYTDLAQGNVAIAFEIEPQHLIVISVLGSTPQGRFDDARKLVESTIKYFRHAPVRPE